MEPHDSSAPSKREYSQIHKRQFPIVWLTGNTGAGKTTLAKGIEKYFNEECGCSSPLARRIITLDGDEMRATISRDEGFSPEHRRKHNLRIARLAKLLQMHGFLVIVSVIAPFSSVREEIAVLCNPLWIYVKQSGLSAPDKPYEPPENPALVIDTRHQTPEEGLKMLQSFIQKAEALCLA